MILLHLVTNMLKDRKRKSITPRIKLQVLARDNYTCQSCGRSPITNPGLALEIDHVQPFSHGGTDELANYQTLCLECNRGKGNNENFNRTIKNELDAVLNYINPQILKELMKRDNVRVVANQEDYVKILEKNSHGNFYAIVPSTNALSGFQAGNRLGIYTLHDNHGSKVNFFISKIISNAQPPFH